MIYLVRGNISRTYITQHQKSPYKFKKWEEDINRYFSKEHSDGQKTHEKMFNVTHHQGNTEQNHDEIPPHTGQNGII